MMSDYAVEPVNDSINEINVEFHGPKESKILHLFFTLISFVFAIISYIYIFTSSFFQVYMKVVFGKCVWSFQMLIHTNLLLLVS